MTLESTPQRRPVYAIVVAPGEVDVATSAALRAEIERATLDTPWVIVDLSAVEFIDSSGLSALLSGRKHAMQRDGGLVLAGVGSRSRKMLRITQLDKVFDLYPTTESVPPPEGPAPRG